MPHILYICTNKCISVPLWLFVRFKFRATNINGQSTDSDYSEHVRTAGSHTHTCIADHLKSRAQCREPLHGSPSRQLTACWPERSRSFWEFCSLSSWLCYSSSSSVAQSSMLTTAAPSFIKLLIHKRHMLRMFCFFAMTNLHEIYLWFLFIFNDAFA